MVAVALGEMQALVEQDQVHLVLTETLRTFVESFNWERQDGTGLLLDIHRLLSQWFLQPHSRLIQLSTDPIPESPPHPVPTGSEARGLLEIWAHETGRILWAHDSCMLDGGFFIGVACPMGLTGQRTGIYNNPTDARCFPLVGRLELQELMDAYEWLLPTGLRGRKISFMAALRNIGAIGALGVEPPSSGSHYKVRFVERRSWTLDRNLKYIPNDYLAQLVPVTGYPLEAIKHALLTGERPRAVLRLKRLKNCVIRG
jgi:hypothetical protein